MTVRTRSGGVYDWTLPGPNKGLDSTLQRRTKPIGGAVTADSLWDNRGRRKVRMSVGGRAVAEIRRDGSWRVYGHANSTGRDITGKAKRFGLSLAAVKAAL